MKKDYISDVMFATTLFKHYWERNEERIKEWIEGKIVCEYQGGPIDFDLFEREFSFAFDEEDVPFGYVVNVLLDFLGPTIVYLFLDGVEERFEKIVDEIVHHLEMEKLESEMQEEEYRRMVMPSQT